MSEDVIATRDEIDAEIVRVLTEKFFWEQHRATSALQTILARGIRMRIRGTVKVCGDSNDDMFLECAALEKAFVDRLLSRSPHELLLGFVLELFGACEEVKMSARKRWETEGKPPIQDLFPYSVHVLTVDLFFYLGMAADLISRNRASHRADIACLYYLPLCSIFTSADKLHKGIAPLFLRSYQTFLPGEDLKTGIKKLNEHYSNLPREVLDRGMMSFAKFPPVDTEFLTTRLWDSFDPEWRELERNPPELAPEMQTALLELVSRSKNESTPLHPQTYIPLEEVGQLTIEKQVSIADGNWHRYSPEVEASSKPRHKKPET